MTRKSLLLVFTAIALALPVYADRKPAVPPRPVARSAPANPTFPEQTTRSSDAWGRTLTDIARHLPATPRYEDAFRRYTRAGDLVTAGHEWTHFLNEHLGLQAGSGKSCYYVLNNRFITLSDPERLRGIVPHVPASLRGNLYQLYLVDNRSNAAVDPLYLFDEWTAYANDVTVAVSQLNEGKLLNPFDRRAVQTQTAGNVLEFTFYGFAVGMAVKQYDLPYYTSAEGAKLREFITFNARRSMEIYRRALLRPELSQGDRRNAALLNNFRAAADTAAMRAWVRADLGDDIASTFGFDRITPAGFTAPPAARPTLPGRQASTTP